MSTTPLPRRPPAFGPEPWEEIGGPSWSHWDRWFCAVAVADQSGSLDPLEQRMVGELQVAPCTTRRRELPSHVELDPKECGLDEVSYAKCEDVKSVSERRLVARLGAANDEALFAITRALGFLLDF